MIKINVLGIKKGSALLGLLLLMGFSIVMLYTFLWAYLSDHKTVYINSFGEANLELVLLSVTIPLGFWGLYYFCQTIIFKKEAVK